MSWGALASSSLSLYSHAHYIFWQQMIMTNSKQSIIKMGEGYESAVSTSDLLKRQPSVWRSPTAIESIMQCAI